MQKIKNLLFASLFISSISLAQNGIISIKSDNNVKQTTKLLTKALKNKGMTVFDVIKHSKGAKKVGKKLRPTNVVIFGNPKVGTPLMQCSQSVAIDLPQKALIWQDESGQVWFSYNDPQYLKNRHHIEGCDKVINKVTQALANFAKIATTKNNKE